MYKIYLVSCKVVDKCLYFLKIKTLNFIMCLPYRLSHKLLGVGRGVKWLQAIITVRATAI